jgi:hypothetical protein
MVVTGEDNLQLGADKNPAHVCLVLTERGRVGVRFREPIPTATHRAMFEEFAAIARKAIRADKEVPKGKYPPDYHIYVVAERRAGPEGISIRADYVGEERATAEPVKRKSLQLAIGMETLDDFRRVLVHPGGTSTASILRSPDSRDLPGA